jgi:hypothetical protein
MRLDWVTITTLAFIGGCTSSPQTYSVYFQSYSTELDPQARQTVQEAADFGRARSWLPIQVIGYAAPADPRPNLDALSAQRAAVVKQLLVDDGIGPNRISVAGDGVIDPRPLPPLSVRRVDISFGPPPGTRSSVAAPGFR